MPAGRPKGVRETRPRDTAARKMARIAISRGLTPLDMMLERAAFAWDIATKRQAEGADDLDVLAMKQIATKEAAQAAPYLHAKLASEVRRILNDDSQRSSEDLRREIEELDRLASVANSEGTVAPEVRPKSNGKVH
jgi:hypothetical protein